MQGQRWPKTLPLVKGYKRSTNTKEYIWECKRITGSRVTTKKNPGSISIDPGISRFYPPEAGGVVFSLENKRLTRLRQVF